MNLKKALCQVPIPDLVYVITSFKCQIRKRNKQEKKHTDKAHNKPTCNENKTESMEMSMGTHCLGVKLRTLDISISLKFLHSYENRH